MPLPPAKIFANVWKSPEILLEQYIYTPGSVEPLPSHAHDEYQFGLSYDTQGEYTYRGATHPIPIASLSVIHSGEAHSPSQRTELPAPATFWMMHIDRAVLQRAAAEIAEKSVGDPFLPTPYLRDRDIVRQFERVCTAIADSASQLEQETSLLDFLTRSIARHAQNCPTASEGRSPKRSISEVCDFLRAHFDRNISLTELSTLAGLSRFHLCRVFRRETGFSPSAYQQQLRIAQSKKRLAQGTPIAKVAAEVGFYDQSHFGWYFKRWVGVTPGNYVARRNIVLDSLEEGS
ncbi:helix-turn-helix transcriptional regulator [Oscillatoriales cyanobacterium LEGE 11467]|uniref:Helix-turn-helix transcriptional regulator n=1 Tax=Zarconia navalis LEGE 11467 TaxID=1828826 RepID=A0A928VXP3_9CYAN|nr:AraC family transcriptional regulator [Zarconia navalis]MBE9042021.1 helix-turn-helix transcriptional regulator [Zarconia navalis LEGE 11467]